MRRLCETFRKRPAAAAVSRYVIWGRPFAGGLGHSVSGVGEEFLRARMLRAVEEILGRGAFQHLAGVDEPDPVGYFAGKAHLVRHADHGHAGLGQTDHGVQHFLDHLGIKRRGRFVEQHDLRLHAQASRNRHPLLLPTRQLRDGAIGMLGQADHFEQFADPMDAARDAELVTTDVWTSMGFEAENEERMRDFADWQVDADMMKVAHRDAVFMHCLPAHRGEEVSADVIDGAQSVVWDEAENRLHTQKALMEFLLLGKLNQN